MFDAEPFPEEEESEARLKILVPIKRVADPENANKVKVSADGTQVTSEGLEWAINPFDEWSLEAALRLTENRAEKKRTGEIIIVGIGPNDDGMMRTLRSALAKGAERGILVEADDASLDSSVVAKILAKIAEKESPDVVFLGKQTADGDSNVAGTITAEHLGWPLVNYATQITVADGGFTIKRELDTGVQTVSVKTPCVLTSSDRILHPSSVKNGITPDDFAYPESDHARTAPLRDIMKAKSKPFETITLDSLGIEAETTVEYTQFELPPARSGETTYVESVDELVQKLHGDAKVI